MSEKNNQRICLNCKNSELIEGSLNYRCNQYHISENKDEISNIIIKTNNPNLYLNMIGLEVEDNSDAINFPKSFSCESIKTGRYYRKSFMGVGGCTYFERSYLKSDRRLKTIFVLSFISSALITSLVINILYNI